MVTLPHQQASDIELWWQMSSLYTYVTQLLERKLIRTHGIGLTDFMALDVMRQAEPRTLQMQELAEEVGLNQSTLSRVATRLERSELAARRPSEHDRRCTVIELTDNGRHKLDLYTETFAAELHTAFEMAALSPKTASFLTRIRPTGTGPST